MATVTFEDAIRIYPGNDRPSVDALNLEIADSEFPVLVGPSGCGKSISLRTLAGLEDVNAGHILTSDRNVIDVQPEDHDIVMVFQNYALYLHITVHGSMGFALKTTGTPKAGVDKHAREAAKILDLTEYLDHKPKVLFGGQRQRVAMGHAIVRKPKVFLMDEPLSNLDAKLRMQTHTQIASLQHSLGITMVCVAYDQTEALTIGNRIMVLKDGVLQQIDTSREMYDHLANGFVAGSIGSPAMNLEQFTVKGDVATVGAAEIQLSKATLGVIAPEDSGKVTIRFRPRSLDVVSAQDEHSIPMRLSLVEELGSDAYIYGELTGVGESEVELGSGKDSSQTVACVPPRAVPGPGETVYVRICPGQEHVFSTSTGKRLPV